MSIPKFQLDDHKSVHFAIKALKNSTNYLNKDDYPSYYAKQLYSVYNNSNDHLEFAQWQYNQFEIVYNLVDSLLNHYGIPDTQIPYDYKPNELIKNLARKKFEDLTQEQCRKLNISRLLETWNSMNPVKVILDEKLLTLKPKHLIEEERVKLRYDFSGLELAYAIYYLVKAKEYTVKHPKTKTWWEFAKLTGHQTIDRIKKEYPKLDDADIRLIGRSKQIKSAIQIIKKHFPTCPVAIIIAQKDLSLSELK